MGNPSSPRPYLPRPAPHLAVCSHEGSGTKCAHRNTSLSDSTEGINEEEADHEEEVAATNGTAAARRRR